MRKVQISPETKAKCEALIHQLKDQDLSRLAGFAAWWQDTCQKPLDAAQDIVQEALRRVEEGLGSKNGRRPKPEDVASLEAFLSWRPHPSPPNVRSLLVSDFCRSGYYIMR